MSKTLFLQKLEELALENKAAVMASHFQPSQLGKERGTKEGL
jgi:hypothetical protein